ncbi:MAG: MFS transporter [candidate division Zixibacteria bacterium]|nr:MFS transporter [candidate division Zixibacteria bacterium]
MNAICVRIANAIRDYAQNLRLFSRNVRLYLSGSFLVGLTFAAYMLLLNLYLREQGSPESFIGTILSAGAVGTSVICIPAALLLRRIRLKRILLGSILVYCTSIVLLSHLPVGHFLVVISFFAGVAVTFYRVAAAPFFMRNTTPRERTFVFSASFGVSLIASMLGSLLFGWLVPQLAGLSGGMISAYQWTFLIGAALGLLALIPFGLIRAADPSEDNGRADFSFTLLKQRLGLYLKLIVPYFVVGTGAGLIIPFLNLYFRDRFGQPPDKIGLFYFLVHGTMLLGIMAGPVLSRRFGMVRTIVWTQLLSIPFMIVLAYTYSLPLAFFAFLIRGALMNLGQPIGSNFSMELVEKHEHALVNALMMLGWNSSWMVSAVIGGSLIERHGYTLPLMITVGLYILSSILYYFFFGNTEHRTHSGYSILPHGEGTR